MEEVQEIQETQQEEKRYINYKVSIYKAYKVYHSNYNNKDYYKIAFKKKNYDGTYTIFYRRLIFATCEPPEHGEIIKIKRGFEDVYVNHKDKYNPIFVTVVLEYESFNKDEMKEKKALDKFRNKLYKPDWADDLPF